MGLARIVAASRSRGSDQMTLASCDSTSSAVWKAPSVMSFRRRRCPSGQQVSGPPTAKYWVSPSVFQLAADGQYRFSGVGVDNVRFAGLFHGSQTTGQFVPGSPYSGGGLSGAGFGISFDPKGRLWVSNFGFSSPVCAASPARITVG